MKPWMKVVMWLGVGFGFGIFTGIQIGQRRSEKEPEEEPTTSVEQNLDEYFYGRDYDGDAIVNMIDDDIEMPTEADIQIDPEIPQLHPQMLIPEIIGEEEYNINMWHYDLENLLFYEMDEVLYNETTQSIIEDPDNVIGIGTLFEFGGDPNNPTDTIFVKNDTFGTLYRIDRLDAAFCDAVDGTCGPDDDDIDEESEDEDIAKDDFWDDV